MDMTYRQEYGHAGSKQDDGADQEKLAVPSSYHQETSAGGNIIRLAPAIRKPSIR